MKIREENGEAPTGNRMDGTRILVVTGDKAIGEATEAALSDADYVATVTGPENAVKRSTDTKPDLVLLDMRAAGAGWSLIHEITENHAIPLILIAHRGSRDVAQAFQKGAADCITDPFEEGETLARVRNALENRYRSSQGEKCETITLGELTVDLPGRRATLAGRNLSLTPGEFQTLWRLARNAGIVIPYATLAERDWGEPADERALAMTCVKNLRRKLGDDARNPTYIETVPGFGYRMNRTAADRGPDQNKSAQPVPRTGQD